MSKPTLSSQLSIRQRLAQKYEQRNIPFGATLELTNRCNLHCNYCYVVRDGRAELSTAEWKSLLDDLADLGSFEVVLTGGEPLVRHDFFEIARHARRRQFVIILFTNATLITEEVADGIANLYPSVVEVSVYGTAETDGRTTGVRGSFERSVQGIRRLRDREIRVTMKISWVKENYQHYDSLTLLAEELGARFRGNVLINYKRDGSPAPQDHSLDDEQLYALLKQAGEREQEELDAEALEAIVQEMERAKPYVPGPCGAGRSGLCVSATGDVYPCVGFSLSLGSIRETPIGEVWRTSEVRQTLRSLTSDDFKDCADCNLVHYCALCPGDNLFLGKGLTECNPESKRIARTMKLADHHTLGFTDLCPPEIS